MQPKSAQRAKFAALPLPALMALLDNDQLRVASENTAIAAVTYWLDQGDRKAALGKREKQQLAQKLQIPHSTHWYLTSCLMDKEHWLWGSLSVEEAVLLLAGAHQPSGWKALSACSYDGKLLKSKLSAVSWCTKEARLKSTITAAKLDLAVSLSELWKNKGQYVVGADVFFDGCRWMLKAAVRSYNGRGATTADGLHSLAVYAHRIGACDRPAKYSYKIKAVPAGNADAALLEARLVAQGRHSLMLIQGVGAHDAYKQSFTSLADASNKLSTFIHANGKLHFTGRVYEVR